MGKLELDPKDARKSYNYLRLGLVGSTAFLALAILIEVAKTDPTCFQTSISGYFYTPVRAVFVGVLVAIGLSLIVIKGAAWEDLALNISGLLAPIVALVPTVNVGECYSIPPEPLPLVQNPATGEPVEPRELALWVARNIENNVSAYLWVALAGVILALLLYWVDRKRSAHDNPSVGFSGSTVASAVLFGIIVIAGLLAFYFWQDFNTTAHNIAAFAMFGFLALAALINGFRDWKDRQIYSVAYFAIAGLMVVSALGILVLFRESFGGYHVLWVEGVEILLFTFYWVLQTAQHWRDRVPAEG